MEVGFMAAKWRELCARVGVSGGSGNLCLQPCTMVLCIVIMLIFGLQHVTGQSAPPDITAKVLIVRLTDLPFRRTLVKSFDAGLEASLWSRNYTVAEGVRVEIIKKETKMKGYASAVEEALNEHNDILAMVGHIGDEPLQFVLPTLQKHNLVSFGPLSGSSAVRGWNPNLYFLRPDPVAELLALIRYALHDLRVLRLGFMYLRGVSFGEAEYEQAKRVMSEMGYELCGVFTVRSSLDSPADDGEFNAAWERFADTLPQAVIVFGSPRHDTTKFIRKMMRDKRTANAYLLAPSAVQSLILTVWPQMVAKGVPFRAGHVITTGANPLAKDTRYEAMVRFQKVMQNYVDNNPNPLTKGIGEDFINNDNVSDLMVAGWISGEVLSHALNNREWLKNRTTFVRSLFNQRQYFVDDIVLGTFGSDCIKLAALQGAICYCNQGSRTVHMTRYVEDYRGNDLETTIFLLRYWDCGTGEKVAAPFNGILLSYSDYPQFNDATSQIVAGNGALKHRALFLQNPEFYFSVLRATVSSAREALLKEMATWRVHAVSGIVTEAMLDVANVTFIDPLQVEPRLNRFRRHVIRLSPTLEQEFFVLAQYLGNTTSASAHAVVRVSEAAAVADVLRRSLVTFGGSLLSTTLLTGGDALEGHLPREGDVFVVGLSAGDAGVLARHLATYSGVRVFVVFTDFAVLYADFVAAFGGGAGADRLVFATNLPHWSDDNTSSLTAQKYIASVGNSMQRTPLSLIAFAFTRATEMVLSHMDRVSAESFADFFYLNVAVSVDDRVYGPFADSTACAVDGAASGRKCEVNYGAMSISVWSLSRSINYSIPPLADPITPSMEYTDPNAGGLPNTQLTVIITGSVLVTVLLVVVVILLIYRCHDSRDNRNAPKEVTDPVTVLFTDIESSTALWAECPEAMPDAVATHHRLIRLLITKYRCYEVKTIGDSFMIACRSVFAALQLARDVQQGFMKHDWGTTAIDDAYRAFEERRAEEDEEYVPPTARLDAAVYPQYWKGLRVRIGVHTGLCDIRHDAVTKGYDYYGSTSNTAARTESVANGGQVLLTRAAYMALSTAEREEVEVTALGAVALRGVPRPVEMYQLDAVPGRTFAALRLEREAVDIDMGTESGDQSLSSSSNNDVLNPHEKSLAALLTELLSPLSLPQRQKVLEILCERWGVHFSFKKSNNTKDCCHAAICRLASRLSRVAARKADTQRDDNNFGWGSFSGSIASNGSVNYSGASVKFDVILPPQRRNSICSHFGSESHDDSESTTTIICCPP